MRESQGGGAELDAITLERLGGALQEYPAGPDLSNNLGDFRPEITVGTLPSAGRRAVELAREPSANHVRKSSVLSSCTGLHELTHVSEDRGSREEPVLDPLRDDSLTVLVDLDVPDRVPPEQVVGGEQSAAGAGEEGELIHPSPCSKRRPDEIHNRHPEGDTRNSHESQSDQSDRPLLFWRLGGNARWMLVTHRSSSGTETGSA